MVALSLGGLGLPALQPLSTAWTAPLESLKALACCTVRTSLRVPGLATIWTKAPTTGWPALSRRVAVTVRLSWPSPRKVCLLTVSAERLASGMAVGLGVAVGSGVGVLLGLGV